MLLCYDNWHRTSKQTDLNNVIMKIRKWAEEFQHRLPNIQFEKHRETAPKVAIRSARYLKWTGNSIKLLNLIPSKRLSLDSPEKSRELKPWNLKRSGIKSSWTHDLKSKEIFMIYKFVCICFVFPEDFQDPSISLKFKIT